MDFTESSTTDSKGKISELVKTLLTDTSIRPGGSDPGIGVANVESTDIRIPHLKRDYQTMGLILSELANLSDSVYGVKQIISQSPNLFFFPRGSKRSNFLISNDIVNPIHITRDWAPQCLCYMRNTSYEYTDSQVDTGHGKIISIGVDGESVNESAAPDSVRREGDHLLSIRVPMDHNLLTGISLHMADKNLADPFFQLNQTEGEDDYTGGTNIVPKRNSDEVIGTVRKWYRVLDFSDDPISVTPGAIYSLIVTSNNPVWPHAYDRHWTAGDLEFSYKNGIGQLYRITPRFRIADGLHLGDDVGVVSQQIAIRVHTQAKTSMIGHNISGANRRKEFLYQAQDAITVPEMTALQIGLLSSVSRTVRKYTTITTSMTQDVPPLGEQIRLIDKFNGLDTYLDIMGYTVSASVDDESNLAPVSMEWTLEKRL